MFPMTGKTHFLVGMNAVWALPFLGYLDQWAVPMLLAGGIAGLLPDIDAAEAEIHGGTGSLTKIFFIHKIFGHRKAFHSVLAAFGLFALFAWALPPWHPGLPWVVALGYASHSFVDGFNTKGVAYCWPWDKFFYLVPSFLRSPVGGWADDLFFVLSVGGISIFLYRYAPELFGGIGPAVAKALASL
jgi:inner membrane protein